MAIRSVANVGYTQENFSSTLSGLNYLRTSSKNFANKQISASRSFNNGRVRPQPFRPSGQNYNIYTNSNGDIRCRLPISGSGPSFNVSLPFTSSPAGSDLAGHCGYGHNNGPNWGGHYSAAGGSLPAGSSTVNFSIGGGDPIGRSGSGYVDYILVASASVPV